MWVTTLRAAPFCIDAYLVDVEVDLASYNATEARFIVVGLPNAAVRESDQRVRGALKNCGYFCSSSITVNLAPADRKKEGSAFDLPMAVGRHSPSPKSCPLATRSARRYVLAD
jgi:magnesium chelatase family protein